MSGVFDTKSGSGYDDDIAYRYQFPRQYRAIAEALIGHWILYREPRRNGGRRAYVAVARVSRIETDDGKADHAYARVEQFLPFEKLVPFVDAGRYFEEPLRALGDPKKVGIFLRGQSIRVIADEDFSDIVRKGLPNASFDLDSSFHQASDTAPSDETPRRIDRILTSRIVREASFRRLVCAAYDNTCAVTGSRIVDHAGNYEAQAAHIWPVAAGGPDTVQNGIALSSTAHWLFDRHLISLTDDYRVLVSKGRIPSHFETVLQSRSTLLLPTDRKNWPNVRFVALHRGLFHAATARGEKR